MLIGLAHPVHGDGAEGHIGGVFIADAVGQWHEQVTGNGDDAGMVSMTGACTGDPVADGDAFDAGADAQHFTGQRIAERPGFGDHVLDRLIGR